MIATFCNTALLPIAVAYFTDTWDNKGILISNAFVFFITNAAVTPLIFLIDPSYFVKLAMRWWLEKKYITNKEPMMHTQKELNDAFENPDIRLAEKYAFLGKTLLMTILYIPIMPIGVIISLGGISIFYFIEKWNVTQRYKRPPSIDSGITFGYLYSFRLFIFVYSISVYIFLSEIFPSYFDFALVSIILYGVLTIIPYARMFTCDLLNGVTFENYDEQYFNFTTKYETQNPLTKNKANHKLLTKLYEKKIVSDEEYTTFAKMIGEGQFVDLMEIYRDRTGTGKGIDLTKLVKKAFNNKNLDKNVRESHNQNKNIIKKAIKQKTQIEKNIYHSSSKINDKKEDLLTIRN